MLLAFTFLVVGLVVGLIVGARFGTPRVTAADAPSSLPTPLNLPPDFSSWIQIEPDTDAGPSATQTLVDRAIDWQMSQGTEEVADRLAALAAATVDVMSERGGSRPVGVARVPGPIAPAERLARVLREDTGQAPAVGERTTWIGRHHQRPPTPSAQEG